MSKNENKKNFLSEFKDFIMKGNIIDMAVGVVIGAAFGSVVTGLVNYIINPLIGLITGGVDLSGLKTIVREADAVTGVTEISFQWGSWIQTIINFLIIAFVIFLILKAIVKAKEKEENYKIKHGKAAPVDDTPKETELDVLKEIRDSMKEKEEK